MDRIATETLVPKQNCVKTVLKSRKNISGQLLVCEHNNQNPNGYFQLGDSKDPKL